MDKNSAIGLTMISILLMVYFYFFAPQAEVVPENQKQTTTIAPTLQASVNQDSVSQSLLQQKFPELGNAFMGEEKIIVLENEDIKLSLSSKGGFVKEVLLKKYKTSAKTNLILLNSQSDSTDLILPTNKGEVKLSDMFFQANISQLKDTTQLVLTSKLDENRFLQHRYKLAKIGYLVMHSIENQGVLVSSAPTYKRTSKLIHTESDLEQSRIATTINFYYVDQEYGSLSETSKDPEAEDLVKPFKWVAFKQKFFNSGFFAQKDNIFISGKVNSSVDILDSNNVKNVAALAQIDSKVWNQGTVALGLYFGPNKYTILENITEGYQENVYMGWPVINLVNIYVIQPIFDFLALFIGNYGIVIFLLVLIIKLFLFPLSYKSYVSMAKIKVLKPEMDEIKARVGDDMSAMQQEQLKLYQSVGVNPLAGCIPVLLQMPVLLAMFNFFPNAIQLRQESFLWATDLSTYDTVYNLPFTIPFYGDHVSLFTILMTISTLLFTYMNNQISTVQGPMIALSYIMPVVFMFILNSLPAGLSFYYFVSNMVTIAQQQIIKLFVDESSIRAKLDTNKKNSVDKPKTGFQKRLADALKAQEEMKAKNKKK